MENIQTGRDSFSWRTIMNYRTELFGFLAVWIVLFHCDIYFGFPKGMIVLRLIHKAISIGNVAVDIFLLFSSIGLVQSLRKNTLKVYYLNRLRRVVLPYLFCAVLFYIWYDFIHLKDGILNYLLNITTINWWLTLGGIPLWYVTFILAAYLIFPLLYHLDEKSKHIGIFLLIVLSMVAELWLLHIDSSLMHTGVEKALSRVPIFLGGILLSDHVMQNTRLSVKELIAYVLGVTAIFGVDRLTGGVYHTALSRWMLGIVGILAVIVLCWVLAHLRERTGYPFKAAKFLGGYSFEIYIIHVLMLKVLEKYNLSDKLPGIVWYFLVFSTALLLAMLLKRVCKAADTCLLNDRNRKETL